MTYKVGKKAMKKKKTNNPLLTKTKISMDVAFEKFLTLIPEFRACLAETEKTFDDKRTLMVFMVFPDDIANNLKKDPKYDYSTILKLVEQLTCEGDERVQTVMCTFFIESLLAVSDEFPVIMAPVLRKLGKNSREHALAWNKFNGVENLGLEK